MADILKIRRSLTTGVVPANGTLSEGELATNIPDKKLWVGDALGNPIEIIDKTLNDLIDVVALDPSHGDRLAWDDSLLKWVPKSSISGLGVVTFDYQYEANDTTPPPDDGYIMCNSTDPSTTTILYISDTDRNDNQRDAFWSEIKEHDWFNIYRSNDSERYESYDVTGPSIDHGDYWEVPVSYYDTAGTAIGNNNRVKVVWRISAAFPHEVLVERDAIDSHPITAITNLNSELLSKMVWKNVWIDGTYEVNDVVRDGDWTMVANIQTTDKPAPVPLGEEQYAYQGINAINQQSTAKQIMFGNRYTLTETAELVGWRIHTVIGNEYDVYIVEDPLGIDITKHVASFVSDIDGWVENNINPIIIGDGVTFDIVVIEHEVDPVSADWTGEWNYTTPNNVTAPSTGGAIQASKLSDVISFHKTDNQGGSRGAELLALSVGDVIDSGNIRWAIQNITDNSTYVSFDVSPALQDSNGVKTFTFETVVAVTLSYEVDNDYWIPFPNTYGLFIADGNHDDIVPDNNAYGIDVKYQELNMSDDWDILAVSSASGGSGGEADLSVIKYREPMNTGLHAGGIIVKGIGDLDVDIALGDGIIVDATTDPFNIIEKDVPWDAQTITVTPLATNTQEIHNIYMNTDGIGFAVHLDHIQPNTSYDNILLGWIELNTNVLFSVTTAPSVIGQTAYSLGDLFQNLNDASKTKGFRVQNSSGLNVYCESGSLLLPGINWNTTPKDQHKFDVPQAGDVNNPIELGFFNQNAEPVIAPQTDLPKYYDDASVMTPLTGGEAVIHYMFYSTSGYSIQIGSKNYIDFSDAFRNIDYDRDNFVFAPGAGVAGRSILVAQIIISKLADDFSDKSLADIVSVINGESGNTISPIDLTLVPQYLLRTYAAEDLAMGDLLSMDVNGNLQKYPASGGEGNSQFTNDTVIIHSAEFINPSNNQGIVAWVNNTSQDTIYYVTAQGNPDGSISYSPVGSHTASGNINAMRLCQIDTTRAGFIWADTTGTHMGAIQINGIGSAPTNGTTRNLGGASVHLGVDCTYDPDEGNMIGVYSSAGTVYNRYCTVSGNSLNSPDYNAISMHSGTQVRCTNEGGNVIVTSINGTSSVWEEAAWNKPFFGTGRYDDQTGIQTVNNCSNHCGLQVQAGNILSQFEHNGVVQTYTATYSSGSSMGTPSVYGNPMSGIWGDLIKTDSGIGYSTILTNSDKVELYEGTVSGTYELIYTSTFSVDPSNIEIQSLMFGSVFAFGIGYASVDANKVYMVDSSITRTDHFVAVAPSAVLQGQMFNADIALPMITLPREYAPGTMYEYGPYKYQVITHNQAVMIVEATTMMVTTVAE